LYRRGAGLIKRRGALLSGAGAKAGRALTSKGAEVLMAPQKDARSRVARSGGRLARKSEKYPEISPFSGIMDGSSSRIMVFKKPLL